MIDKDDTECNLYKYDCMIPSLFSKWFPFIEGKGFKTPESTIIPVPQDVFIACYDPHIKAQRELIESFVKENIASLMQEHKTYFCKNGSFSNKFNFKDCWTYKQRITESFININYAALCCEAGGVSEFILREPVFTRRCIYSTIYNGMPLRPEFRVFYDFTNHKPLYIVNYWDYDYCAEHIYDPEDRKVFDDTREYLDTMFNKHKFRAMRESESNLRNVTGLDGIWSVDLMMADDDTFFLIDMAVGIQSAYWDAKRIAEKGGVV